MSTFSTTVTKAKRNAVGQDVNGFSVSPDSRHNINAPGYNRSPFEPKPSAKQRTLGDLLADGLKRAQKADEDRIRKVVTKKPASVQVRPTTKRGQRAVAPTSKDIMLQELPVETFFDTSCELATPRDVFIAIHSLSHGKPCVGCAYDVHSKTGCPAKQQLLRERGLIK